MEHKDAGRFRPIRLVCFGGGTGLPSLLSGLKRNPWLEVTAIVNMFDNGGSSGELKDRFGILPPGDILKCLLALSEDEVSARNILLKRIAHELQPGHTGGNVLLLALEKVYGSYPAAIDALGQILSIKGLVLPVTLELASLCARHVDGSVSSGEVSVDDGMRAGRDIESLYLNPHAHASPQALEAIRTADAFCIGPGSFFTSVLPNFLPNGIREAMAATSVPAMFVCNLLTEGKGMEAYRIDRIIHTVERSIGRSLTTVIANARLPEPTLLQAYAAEDKQPILPTTEDPRVIAADLWTDPKIARHDSERLAHIVFASLRPHLS